MGEPFLVSELKKRNQGKYTGKCTDYVFIAYTAEQFDGSRHDEVAMQSLAAKATREAGVEAYWIGSNGQGKRHPKDSEKM